MNKEKQIKSGRLLEVSYFPCTDSGRPLAERAPKSRITSEQQALYNAKQSTKKLIRLINANFDTGDIYLHCTYSPENAPQSSDKAYRDAYNYIRRIRYYRRKHKLPELRAVVIMEEKTYKTGKYAGLVNIHFHIFMNNSGFGRDRAEDMWKFGWVNANRYNPDVFGPETAARYVSKDPKGRKRWFSTQNLKKPIERTKKRMVTNRYVNRLAKYKDDRAFWENKYPGYIYERVEVCENEYNSHTYVTAILFKKRN